MNDIIFSESFGFHTLVFDKFSYTDNRNGAPSHFFAYMLSGSCEIVTNADKVEISKGDIFYIPDKCSYQSYWYGDPEIRFISLAFRYMPNFENRTYPVQVIPFSESAALLFEKLPTSAPLTAYDIGVFYTLAGLLIPAMKYNSFSRTQELVQRVQNLMSQNPRARISELAEACAVSEASLYSAFQKESGITPNTLRNNLILDQAKDMLITTDKPIEQICDFLGFSSASYFRKKFKARFNITPREMRKRYRI